MGGFLSLWLNSKVKILVRELFRISFRMNYEVEAGVRGEPILYGGDRLSKQECVSNSVNNKQMLLILGLGCRTGATNEVK